MVRQRFSRKHVSQRARAGGRSDTHDRRWTRAAPFLLAIVVALATNVYFPHAQHLASMSEDLLRWQLLPTSSTVRVIVGGTQADLGPVLARQQLPVIRWLHEGAVVTVNTSTLMALASEPVVTNLSGDIAVSPTLAISDQSTGADHAWRGGAASFPFGAIPGVTGRGIGVAVIDSGISPHEALAGKIVASVSLVAGEPEVTDGFGHGTHVAGIIAGAPVAAKGTAPAFAGGIAPGAHLVNIRVLSRAGLGYTSDVIAGIDWAIAHRVQYNIRAINLSLGHPVMEPAITDPLCQAVARAVSQGLVVAVSAGNGGRSASGGPVLGGIASPGNSPFALTVGALNTWSSVDRHDDTVAEYSSRGPARFDLAMKPDLAAPGTRIESLEAHGSYLPANYPALHSTGAGAHAYMRLSGTSMAAPMVSGAIAALLEGSPGLTATQVKLVLQAGATYVRDAGLMGAGAGSLDIWASRALATSGLARLVVGTNGEMPGGASFWDAGTLAATLYEGAGARLLSLLDLTAVWTNPAWLRVGELNLIGLLNPLREIAPNALIWGEEVSDWTGGTQILWGSTVRDSNGSQVVWGSDDQIIWGSTDDSVWASATLTSPNPP
jgi:serine protease AprX